MLQNIESTKTDALDEEKADSGQNSGSKTQTEKRVKVKTDTRNNAERSERKVTESQEYITENKSEQNATEPPTKKPTAKPNEKPTNPPTQPPTEAKTIDIHYVVSSCISYGKQLGMNYDSTLNTSNASWFSPTNAEYYSDTQSLLNDCYNDVEYKAYFYQDSGI